MVARKLLRLLVLYFSLILILPVLSFATTVFEQDIEDACHHAATIAQVRIDHSQTKAEWNEKGEVYTTYKADIVEVLKGKTNRSTVLFSSKGGTPEKAPSQAAIDAKPTLTQCVGPNNTNLCGQLIHLSGTDILLQNSEAIVFLDPDNKIMSEAHVAPIIREKRGNRKFFRTSLTAHRGQVRSALGLPDGSSGRAPVPHETALHKHDPLTCNHDRARHINPTKFINELKEIIKEQKTK